MPLDFAGSAKKIQPGDIEEEAKKLGCDAAVIKAVCDVEAAGSGFLPDGRPKILFEAHVFWTLTNGYYGESNVSSPVWDRTLYGPGGAHQYDRLAQAILMDRASALKSASWGMFQIMGENYSSCGFISVEAFVAAMEESERRHLDAFAAFVTSSRLDKYLKTEPPDFTRFARGYNGPGQVTAYAGRLTSAWRKFQTIIDPPATSSERALYPQRFPWAPSQRYDHEVAVNQQKLNEWVEPPLTVDGILGPETEAAIRTVQSFVGLPETGQFDAETMAALDGNP